MKDTKPYVYIAGYAMEAGNFVGLPPVCYRSHHWAKSHFETQVNWLWIEKRKMWVAQTQRWPRPVVYQVELKD